MGSVVPADLVAAVRGVVEETIVPSAVRTDRDRAFPQDGVRALGEVGALGLMVPSKHGGAGGGLAELALVCEVLGEACASTAMVYLMHSVTAATVACGEGATGAQVLAAMVSGQVLGSLAFSERGTGARFYAPDLRVSRSNGRLSVSGRKAFVTSAGFADVYLLLVQSEIEDAADIYMVSASANGIRAVGEWRGLGMAGNASTGLELADVAVGDEDRIGGVGDGGRIVFEVVAPCFLVGLAAVSVGIASAAARSATAHVVDRQYADGSRLAEVPHIQHLLAEMDAVVRQACLLVRDAARLGDAGDQQALVAIMEAKIVATEAAVRAASLALEATGGQGYTPALPIERHLRDAQAGPVMAPTNAVLRTWVGKALAGLPVP